MDVSVLTCPAKSSARTIRVPTRGCNGAIGSSINQDSRERGDRFRSPMLFYAKKELALELLVAVGLGGVGWLGASFLGVAIPVRLDAPALAFGIVGAAVLTAWTFAVQTG